MSNLKTELNKKHSVQTWLGEILKNTKGSSNETVQRQLVGATLARRFKSIDIPNYPAHASDRQTERAGDFAISQLVYHVTSAPSRDVLQKCATKIKAGLQRNLFCITKPQDVLELCIL